MEIVKAEILWTRKCHLACYYCSMATGESNTPSLSQWKEGIDNIKKLGAGFIAFYGAEPFADFDKLPETVGYAESKGIATTVISSGIATQMQDKLIKLYKAGGRSLTMSYDAIPLSKDSEIKSDKAIRMLEFFKSLGQVRDVAVVMTLNRENFVVLPAVIREMTEKGIWTLFDVIHADRKQEGSKCKGSGKGLLFEECDFPLLDKTLDKVELLKDNGALVHTSKQFINKVRANDFSLLRKYNWNCAREENFPAWITVDCDGKVYVCDDFQPQTEKEFFVWNLHKEWDSFCSYRQKQTLNQCPGCCWNTHIDAHFIKRGEITMEDYTHDKV